MGQKEKLIEKLKSKPKDFTFDEVETILGYFGYQKSNKGKTSGSRVMFSNSDTGGKIILHKPHSRKELLEYEIKLILSYLLQEGLL